MKRLIVAVCTLGWLAFFVLPTPAAVISQYKILDTETVIDTANTTAMVDTTEHEIRLPQDQGGRKISFLNETFDYVTMANGKITHFSFDGESMLDNPIASVSGLSNPLAVFASGTYPDVVVANETEITHYSFTGTDMMENPALSVFGLTSVVSVASRENNDIAFLEDGELKHYTFDGEGMSSLPALSINSCLNNPIEAALFQDSYNVAILENNRVRFFYFTGDELSEAPDMAISGFTNPLKSISVLDGTVSVVEGNQVKTYLYDGSGYSYAQALSVTNNLTAPTCVALRPGSRDMIISDGNEVKYFMFDGNELIYNPDLSKQVDGLADGNAYKKDAVVQSNALTGNSTATRVTAYCHVPAGTSIIWSLKVGTSEYVPMWRVRGLEGSTVLEHTLDAGVTWKTIGTATTPVPGSDIQQLWYEYARSGTVRWKADLHTDNPGVTPKIKSLIPGVIEAVRVERNSKPIVVINPENCYLTMTPTIPWTFSDADDDAQVKYEFRIKSGTDDLYKYDHESSDHSHTMLPSEDPVLPSKLWNSGLNKFTLWLRVYDGIQWSEPATKQIEFRAFERPRVIEISVPSDGYVAPNVGELSTHKVIKMGMAAGALPKTKAGGQVTMFIDSLGVDDIWDSIFHYAGKEATLYPIEVDELKAGAGQNKRWKISFYTDPSKVECPDGTLVEMQLTGKSGVYEPVFNCPNFAEGVVMTKGSVLDDWRVVLQGSEQ